ncbi:MAG: 50S ribosomal protein L19 [Candidatus Omnitrophica bacterium]|nr:50S ribosomal protein L19 [Candidatus Omnitrophota bacterium]
MKKIEEIEAGQLKKDIPDFSSGDTLRVSVRVPEAEGKFRLHDFEGVVISKRGKGIKASFTLRKISFGEGVERVFPLHSPTIDKITLVKKGKAKRSKLYYLRQRIGKEATKVEVQE